MTEIGSKWPKEQKRRREVWENDPSDEKIEENGSSKEDGSWTNQQAGKSTNGCFGVPCRKVGKIGW